MKAATGIVGFRLLVLSDGKGASENKPAIYVIKNGSSGWVKIFYDRRDEKELPLETSVRTESACLFQAPSME